MGRKHEYHENGYKFQKNFSSFYKKPLHNDYITLHND